METLNRPIKKHGSDPGLLSKPLVLKRVINV